jgi:hypothetical protein
MPTIFVKKMNDLADVQKAIEEIGVGNNLKHKDTLVGMYCLDRLYKPTIEELEKMRGMQVEELDIQMLWWKKVKGNKSIPVIVQTKAYIPADDNDHRGFKERVFMNQIVIEKETRAT